MKYAILADIHGNLEAFQAALKDAAQQHCTHYCCLGDLVGYGANPVECLELVRTGNMPCVRGDHDEYGSSEGPLDMFGPHAAEALVWTRQQLSAPDRQWLRDLKYIRLVANFCLVHATLDQPHRWAGVFDKLMAAASFTYQTTSVCFCGHTHVPTAFVRDAVLRAAPIRSSRSSRTASISSTSAVSANPGTAIRRPPTWSMTWTKAPSKSGA